MFFLLDLKATIILKQPSKCWESGIGVALDDKKESWMDFPKLGFRMGVIIEKCKCLQLPLSEFYFFGLT